MYVVHEIKIILQAFGAQCALLHSKTCRWCIIILFIIIYNAELTPKVVASDSAFWRGEVENELCRIGMADFKFWLDANYDKCMAVIDESRQDSIYPHPPSDCTENCLARG